MPATLAPILAVSSESGNQLVTLAAVPVLGILAQWLAWRLKLPSILLLLLVGFLAGPVSALIGAALGGDGTKFIDPDHLMGKELLFPFVSLCVALILYEGGISLRFSELREVGRAVRNMITIGVVVAWALGTLAAYLILGFEIGLALLLGAILVVTGPTVIMPLLRHVRPVERVGSVVKWEGIINDPIGALLAVLVFEVLLASGPTEGIEEAINGILRTVLAGGLLGMVAGGLLILVMRRNWVPDYLHSSVSLMLVLAAFTVANVLQSESGLFTVTIMGIFLANQKVVRVRHIIEFKENLAVLLLSILFILLAARVEWTEITRLSWRSAVFLAALILVVRPATVFISTIGTRLSFKEKLFVAWMAPRGIVAAAVASLFGLELARTVDGTGQPLFPQAAELVPVMFLVIVGTVVIYGLTAAPLARWLGLASPRPQGLLLVGAHDWARKVARAVRDEGFHIVLVDTNWGHLSGARMDGLPSVFGNILSENTLDKLELGGIGRLIALTRNDEVNSLACLRFVETFGRTNVFQLSPATTQSPRHEMGAEVVQGRVLFAVPTSFEYLSKRFAAGAIVKKTRLTSDFNFDAFKAHYHETAVPLFLIDEARQLQVFNTDNPLTPKAGHTIISLVDAQDDSTAKLSQKLKKVQASETKLAPFTEPKT